MPRNTSRRKGNTINSTNNVGSHFRNAKVISRSEEGLKLVETAYLGLGKKGVLEDNDGIRIKVEVFRDIYIGPDYKEYYRFRDENGKIYDKDYKTRFTGWDFYTFIDPVPFVPRKSQKKQRKTQRKYA